MTWNKNFQKAKSRVESKSVRGKSLRKLWEENERVKPLKVRRDYWPIGEWYQLRGFASIAPYESLGYFDSGRVLGYLPDEGEFILVPDSALPREENLTKQLRDRTTRPQYKKKRMK